MPNDQPKWRKGVIDTHSERKWYFKYKIWSIIER